ncbi:unnamed protein product [Schistosoma rodhaini]|uniref:Tetraspanin n=1 Tax=Schistosoma rodhaini TaxID=6188 RepID=A0AA85ETC0_9TREM|nr:unnamed protein product [Schistosoma rodhaini]
MASPSCAYKCLKIFLAVFNILIFACGIALIVVGSISRVAIINYSSGIDSNINCLLIFVIVFGCFLLLLGFLGFCGLSTENTCCLIVYTVLLSVMVAAEIAAGIAAVALKKDVKTQFLSSVKSLVPVYDKNPNFKKFLDKIQQEFQCCGSESSNDYTSVGQTIPDSCKNTTSKVTYSNGCSNKVISFFEKYIVAVLVAVLGICLIVMGSYVHLFLSTFLRNLPVHMLSLTFIMMALGCLLFSLGSIGILFVLTGRRKINAIMGMMFRNIIKDSIKHYMRKNSYAAFVNTIQLQHKCCGADSVMDYTVSNLSVPVSCYPEKGTTPHSEGMLSCETLIGVLHIPSEMT